MNPEPNRFDLALELIKSGISVIPIEPDGSKSPAIESWKGFQYRFPQVVELYDWWFENQRTGIAAIAGKVSGNLEDLDIDDLELFEPWRRLVEQHDGGAELLAKLVLIETPRPGYAVVYRCSIIAGNQKLAEREVEVKGGLDGELRRKTKTLIETRGEGGYFILPGSPPGCHERCRPYVLKQGSLTAIPTITPEEREILHSCARVFDETPPQEPKKTVRGPVSWNGNRPGDDFNSRTAWPEILEPAGWKRIYSRGEETYRRRPEKKVGWSATTNYGGSDMFHVFSTNADPFEGEATYSKFAAFTLLNHGGDFRAAAKALAARGFGSNRSTEREPEPEPEPPPWEDARPENAFTAPPHWKLLDVSKVREWNCEPLDWVVEHIIARDNLVWVSADSQSGKTLLGLYMSLQFLQEGKLYGKFPIKPVKKILYLGLEDPDRRFQERILDMMREGDTPIDPDRFHVYIAPGLTINDDLKWAWLVNFIETGGYDLVYLDTFQRATPGISSFDDAKQSGILHRLLDLVRRLKIVIIVHDHLAKNREKKRDAEMSMHDTKGSVNKEGNADCMIRLQIETITPRRIAIRVWLKEADQETGFLLDVAPKGSTDGPKYTYAGDLIALAKTAKAKGEKTRNEIISAMQGASWISTGELAAITRLSLDTIQRHLKKLTAERIVEAEGEGKLRRYRLLSPQQEEQAKCGEL